MWKKLSLIVLLGFVLFSFSDDRPHIEFMEGSFKESLKLAKQTSKLVFVFVGADHCDNCRHTKESFTDSSVAAYFNEHFINYHMDPDKLSNNYRLSNWGVTSIPTLLFMDAKKNIVYRAQGYQTVAKMLINGNAALQAQKEFEENKGKKKKP